MCAVLFCFSSPVCRVALCGLCSKPVEAAPPQGKTMWTDKWVRGLRCLCKPGQALNFLWQPKIENERKLWTKHCDFSHLDHPRLLWVFLSFILYFLAAVLLPFLILWRRWNWPMFISICSFWLVLSIWRELAIDPQGTVLVASSVVWLLWKAQISQFRLLFCAGQRFMCITLCCYGIE